MPAAAHFKRPPTLDELRKDVESVVQQLSSAWDSEVDVVVILSPRNVSELAMSSNASKLKIEHLLRETRRKLAYAHPVSRREISHTGASDGT